MYYIRKEFTVSISHTLDLNYQSKCTNLHGHNLKIIIHCKGEALDNNGMLVDFSEIKNKIHDQLDHKHLNKILAFNPTAENIAWWCVNQIDAAYKCEVYESENNLAIYEIQD